MKIEYDVSLAERTTLGLGGPAKRFVRATSVEELRDALASAGNDPVLVLGSGSNLVVRDGGFSGLVIEIALAGVSIVHERAGTAVAVGAGVMWDDFVARMVEEGLRGVTCLSGIPGLVGATPMQNVGAYGQEVSDTIVTVRVLDRQTGEIREWPNIECQFGYRTSVFRGSDRWIVLGVQFWLRQDRWSEPIRYPELARSLGLAEGETAPLVDVRRTVLELRRRKGMVVDPADPESKSAGSFFTNPIVDPAIVKTLFGANPEMPHWLTADGKVKLAAAWLIEHAGFAKGHVHGKVGISKKHALALVNRGGTARELLALAESIQDGVRSRFGIALQREPIVVGED